MDYTGRNALVLGLGLTGYSLARYLAMQGASVRVADTRPAPPFADRLAASLPAIPLATGPLTEATFAGVDLVAISPGVAGDHPALVAAVARGAELAGDIELFARALPPAQKVIAITGSNGKTTVTALTGALCRAAGLRTVVAGNIGDAVLDALPADGAWPDVYVLELSSFQLESTSRLSPIAATVLNVTDNHLDRYAGMDAYAAAKARIFAGGGIQVLNRDDPRSLAMRIAGRVVQTFGAGLPESEEAWGFVERGGDRHGVWLARGGALLLPVADLKLVGRHNALNALAALALASAVAPVKRDMLVALARVRRPPAPDAADRRIRRRALRQRLEGHHGRRDACGAGGARPAGRADRRRRWQGAGIRGAAVRDRSALPRRAAHRQGCAGDRARALGIDGNGRTRRDARRGGGARRGDRATGRGRPALARLRESRPVRELRGARRALRPTRPRPRRGGSRMSHPARGPMRGMGIDGRTKASAAAAQRGDMEAA